MGHIGPIGCEKVKEVQKFLSRNLPRDLPLGLEQNLNRLYHCKIALICVYGGETKKIVIY